MKFDDLTENQKKMMLDAYEVYKRYPNVRRSEIKVVCAYLNLNEKKDLEEEYNYLLDMGLISHDPVGMLMRFVLTDLGVEIIKGVK